MPHEDLETETKTTQPRDVILIDIGYWIEIKEF
jgi:hypothetical protein